MYNNVLFVNDEAMNKAEQNNIYASEWSSLNIEINCKKIEKKIQKIKRISIDCSFTRVNLYCANERINFRNLFFYPWSSYEKFIIKSFIFTLVKNFFDNKGEKIG